MRCQNTAKVSDEKFDQLRIVKVDIDFLPESTKRVEATRQNRISSAPMIAHTLFTEQALLAESLFEDQRRHQVDLNLSEPDPGNSRLDDLFKR